jgi:hypothetical protein
MKEEVVGCLVLLVGEDSNESCNSAFIDSDFYSRRRERGTLSVFCTSTDFLFHKLSEIGSRSLLTLPDRNFCTDSGFDSLSTSSILLVTLLVVDLFVLSKLIFLKDCVCSGVGSFSFEYEDNLCLCLAFFEDDLCLFINSNSTASGSSSSVYRL